MFVNPPENDMMWPDYIGGGYHYMKMNGHWKDLNNIIQPFGFHLGIGQIYDSVNHSTIIGFVQNYFTVTMPNSSFSIVENATTKTGITMNIESWFATPHVYDLNVWGGSIMQNQAAMHTVAENGADAFSFQLIP
jgi:hypothetical protein